jgi:hypothetical protein
MNTYFGAQLFEDWGDRGDNVVVFLSNNEGC